MQRPACPPDSCSTSHHRYCREHKAVPYPRSMQCNWTLRCFSLLSQRKLFQARLREYISCTMRSQRVCQAAKRWCSQPGWCRHHWHSRKKLDEHHLVFLLGSSFRSKWPLWSSLTGGIPLPHREELSGFEARLKRLLSPTSILQSVHR